jgi:hypothetical protein
MFWLMTLIGLGFTVSAAHGQGRASPTRQGMAARQFRGSTPIPSRAQAFPSHGRFRSGPFFDRRFDRFEDRVERRFSFGRFDRFEDRFERRFGFDPLLRSPFGFDPFMR